MAIYIPELTDDQTLFPEVNSALENPDGLLAMGGDLSPQRIINGYRNGIFPWFSNGEPILWWSPSKRAIISPGFCHISSSMRKLIKTKKFTVTVNSAFAEVISNCAAPRPSQADTWITDTMMAAYIKLHQRGFAHSVEVWQEQKLVGGLYGICVGTLFCGESMFSKVSNSSKIAFIALNQHLLRFQGKLIDCQMQTTHLRSMGVEEVTRTQYLTELVKYSSQNVSKGCWDTQLISVNSKMAKSVSV